MSQQLILRDFQKVRREKSFFDDARIIANFERDDVSDFRIFILPVHGFFRNCLVRFSIKFDDYPNKKPSPKCLTKIYHPNVSNDGSICYSMFGNDWKKEFKLLDYVNGFVFLLGQPNHGDPLNSSCVQHDPKKFDELVQKGATGVKLGSYTYDYCLINHKFKDSKDFGKNLKPLLFFLDQKKITAEIERKIKELEGKIGQLEQTKKELHVKFVVCIENVNLALTELSKHGSIDNFEDFKSEEFDKAKGLCEEYYKRIHDVYNLEMKVEKVWKQVQDAHPPHKIDPTFVFFEQAFQPLRETCDKVSSLLQEYFVTTRKMNKKSSEEEQEGEEEEEEEKKEPKEEVQKDPQKVLEKLNETIASVSIFLDKCDQLLDCENKVVTHKKRVGNNAEFSIEIIAMQFIPFDFEILDQQLQKLYGDLNMDSECKRIFEGIKLVLDVRRNSKEIYELELLVMKEMQNLKALHDKDGSPEEWIRKLLYADLMNEFDKSTRSILDSLHPRVSEEVSKVDPDLERVKLILVETRQKVESAKKDAVRLAQVEEKLKSFIQTITLRVSSAASIFTKTEDEKTGSEIISRFENLFIPVREFWKDRMSNSINNENIHKFCAQVFKLFENSEIVFDLEMKLLNHLKILKSRLRSGMEEVLVRFERVDLEKNLFRMRDEIHAEHMKLEKSDLEENSQQLVEKVNRVKEVLRNSEKLLECELDFVKTKNMIDNYRERHLWVEQEIIPKFDMFKNEGRKILDDLHEQINFEQPKFDELCQKVVSLCKKAEDGLKEMKKVFERQIRKHFQELLGAEVKLMVFWEKLGRKFPKKKGRVFQQFDRAFQQTRETRDEMRKCFAKEKFVKEDDEEVEGEEDDNKKKRRKKKKQQKKKIVREEETTTTVSTMKREEMKKLCDRMIPYLDKCEKILGLEIKNQELMGRTRNMFKKRDPSVYLNFTKNGFLTLNELTNKLYDPKFLNLKQELDEEFLKKVTEVHTFRTEKLEKLFKYETDLSRDLDVKNRRLEREFKSKNEVFQIQKKEIRLLLNEFHMSTYFVVFEKKEGGKKKKPQQQPQQQTETETETETSTIEERVEKKVEEARKSMEEYRLTQKKIKDLVLEKKRKQKLNKRLKKLRRKKRTGGGGRRRRRGGGGSLLQSVFEEEDV